MGPGRATADMLTGIGGSSGRYSGGFASNRPSKVIKVVINSTQTLTINVPDRIPIIIPSSHSNDEDSVIGGNKSQSWVSNVNQQQLQQST